MKRALKLKKCLFVYALLLLGVSLNAQVIYEAEDASFSSGAVETEHTGFTGDGYVNTDNFLGEYVEWTINSLKDVNDTIAFRYALAKKGRPMQIYINDVLTDTIKFDSIGPLFTDYEYDYTVGQINVGENTIKLVSLDAEGAPNLDHMTIKNDTNVYVKLNLTTVGNGNISIEPVADSFLFGERVKITATAEAGNTFAEWSGDKTTKQNPLSFTMDKNYNLSATFNNTLPAFPGAEGFAKNITGGRGGAVIEVTNTNDSGLGSLRAAINANGPRTIVFRVSGNIVLTSDLKISKGDVTIAGQTAPGDGITLSGYPLKISADNVIVRYIRSRLGDVTQIDDDAMNGRDHQNIILDHCTMSWSVDEAASFYDNTNFTMQYCLISESLYHSGHIKGNHGYGGIWGGKGASFHHNLLAHHTSRNPRFCGSRYTLQPDLENVDFRNNVIYNWGFNSVYGAEGGSYNLVNNYYKYGPATSSSVRSRIIAPDADSSGIQPAGVWGTFYINGNYVNGYPAITQDNWGGVSVSGISKDDIKSDTEFDFDSVTTQDAKIAFEHVVAQAGVCLPKRDVIDQRIIQETITGTATYGETYNGGGVGIIDSQVEVGGWPALSSTTPPTDTDKDGMPDDWEIARSLDPNNADDRNGDDDSDGYTNLEEYLNGLVEAYTYIIRPLDFAVSSLSNTEVVLTWDDVTDDETGFLLERKSDGDYEQIAEISANTTSYTDEIPSLANYTYRLRAYNATDTSYYTDTAYVKLVSGIERITSVDNSLIVYPNPFNDKISIEILLENEDNIEISIYNIAGEKISEILSGNTAEGKYSFDLNTSDLASGIYYLSVRSGNNVINRKITKM